MYFCNDCKRVFARTSGYHVSKCPNCRGENFEELIKNKAEVVQK